MEFVPEPSPAAAGSDGPGEPQEEQGERGETDEAAAGSSWEKCARMLTLNSLVTLGDFQKVADMILGNICQHPGEMKYRTLKLSNKTIDSRVLPVKGGLQYFLACGFERGVNPAGEKVLSLGTDPSAQAAAEAAPQAAAEEVAKAAAECMEWLRYLATPALPVAMEVVEPNFSVCFYLLPLTTTTTTTSTTTTAAATITTTTSTGTRSSRVARSLP
jgi:hypothetical protein